MTKLTKLTKEEKKRNKILNLERSLKKELQATEADFNEKNGISYNLHITINGYSNDYGNYGNYGNYEFNFENEEFVEEIPYYGYEYHIKEFAISYYNSINKTLINREVGRFWVHANIHLVKHYTFLSKNGEPIEFWRKLIREKEIKK